MPAIAHKSNFCEMCCKVLFLQLCLELLYLLPELLFVIEHLAHLLCSATLLYWLDYSCGEALP